MDGDTKVFNLTAEIVDWEVQRADPSRHGPTTGWSLPSIQVNLNDKVLVFT